VAILMPASIVLLLPRLLSQALVLILTALSIWVFIATVKRRGLLRMPQPGEVSFDHLGKRLWQTFLEVVLQSRVVRDRPVAGLLHAAVFWGFLAFAWVSARHFYIGFRGLDTATENHSWYGDFAAAWALAVLVGILGLAFRRFVLRPAALGKLSITSGIVAALISLLMVTYLLGWRVLSVGSAAWEINWWAHTFCFLGMLVVIPQSKHLHLVLAPIAIFFRPDRTSATRALKEEGEDLGLVRFKELGWKDVLDVNACVECGRCTQFCPANITGGSLSPKEIILSMQHGLLAGGDLIAGSLAEQKDHKTWVTDDDLFQCLSCGACEYVCPVGIEHVGRKILDLRRGLVSEGRIESEKIVQLFTAMERAPHNPWGIAQDTRQRLVQSKQFPVFDGSQEWLFWLGCGLSFDPHGQTVASAMKQILDAAGISWGVLARETCCGEPARRAGNEYLYLQLSEKLIESFRNSKVKNILSCCPHCTMMLDRDYRQIAAYNDLNIHVLHHSEFIAELLPKLFLQPSAQSIAFHDPCQLARGRGVTQQPRQILERCGASLKEPQHHGENTFCCGAGGAQLFITDDRREETKERVNQRRFAEIMETKAAAVAVACPYCPIMLRDAAGHAKHDDVPILDIAEILASRLPSAAQGDQRGKS
jgi:Fe-S oxidoreductase